MGFKSDLTNNKKFLQLDGVEDKFRRSIRQTWFQLGKDLKAEADNEILNGIKTGRIYRIKSQVTRNTRGQFTSGSGRVRRHQSSAPGETHANLSGALRRSISWVVQGTESMKFGYGFSTTESNKEPPYSGIEFGITQRNIKPRPSLLNAIKATQRRASDHFLREMAKEFKRT